MKEQFAVFTLLVSLLISVSVGAQTIVLDGVPIGVTNPKEGHFTNLEATTQITLGAETITNFSGLDDDKVKVSSGDTSDYLESQIVGGTGVTVNSDGSQITISAPPVNVEDSADGVEVTYAGEGEYDTGTSVVPALDLNGTNLVVNQTDPTVTVGGITSTVLASSASPQQVIVRVPQGLNAGNYKLKVKNSNGFSEGLVPLQQTFFDGSTWSQATANAAWSDRIYHCSVVYDNKIWVIGGEDGSNKNDVWSSSDGITWTQVTAAAAWSARKIHTSVVFDDGSGEKMWVMGGLGSSNTNDVWSSSDGITWTQATASANWSVRIFHSSVVFDNKIWVIGGTDNGSHNGDVWYSSDGISWTQATANAPWVTRYAHSSLVYNNKIWVIGGYQGGYKNDVWSSTDGTTWTQATAGAPWAGRLHHTSLVFNNKIWVIGGGISSGGVYDNDVWHTSN